MFVNRNAKLLSLVLSIIFIFAVIVPSRASALVPSRFMRKIVCRLRLSEVSRQ